MELLTHFQSLAWFLWALKKLIDEKNLSSLYTHLFWMS